MIKLITGATGTYNITPEDDCAMWQAMSGDCMILRYGDGFTPQVAGMQVTIPSGLASFQGKMVRQPIGESETFDLPAVELDGVDDSTTVYRLDQIKIRWVRNADMTEEISMYLDVGDETTGGVLDGLDKTPAVIEDGATEAEFLLAYVILSKTNGNTTVRAQLWPEQQNTYGGGKIVPLGISFGASWAAAANYWSELSSMADGSISKDYDMLLIETLTDVTDVEGSISVYGEEVSFADIGVMKNYHYVALPKNAGERILTPLTLNYVSGPKLLNAGNYEIVKHNITRMIMLALDEASEYLDIYVAQGLYTKEAVTYTYTLSSETERGGTGTNPTYELEGINFQKLYINNIYGVRTD